MALNIWWYC